MAEEVAPVNPLPLLLKVEETARLLNIGRTRVFDLLRTGKLESVKIFGSRRIPLESIHAYIKTLLQEQGAA
jgi:excisionase family DNA binding protein